MFTKRIIPCLDVHGGRVVKGVNFVNLKDAGDPVEIAAAYDQGRGRRGGFPRHYGFLRRQGHGGGTWCAGWQRRCSSPLRWAAARSRVGGRFQGLLREGADKVSVNSAAIMRPELISEAADKFGSQCVVVAIDAKRRARWKRRRHLQKRRPRGYGHRRGGMGHAGRKAGGGEILLTSMDCDGTKNGYDLELTAAVAGNVSIPVIASGGAGTKEDFYDALTKGGADAALAASLFHYKELEIMELKRYLAGRGVPVRL